MYVLLRPGNQFLYWKIANLIPPPNLSPGEQEYVPYMEYQRQPLHAKSIWQAHKAGHCRDSAPWLGKRSCVLTE